MDKALWNRSTIGSITLDIEWFEVAILDGFEPSLVQPQTKKHWLV
jgi:hypothetical protein